jgi:2-octaprenyl-6-methoxyphenol hydroxylase
MANTVKTDILIIGGGAPGLALAALLAPLGLDVAVVDAAPFTGLRDVKQDARTAALMQGSVRILRAAGAWDACAPHGADLRTLRIVDENGRRGAAVTADFRASEIGLDAFAVNMPNAILRAALCDRARAIKNITLLPGRRLADFTAGTRVCATLDDGTTIDAALIVGADGRESTVRAIAGIDSRTQEFGQSAITCLIEHNRPHDNISTEFHRPSGPFTLVPLPGKTSSVVWVEHTADADALMTVSRPSFMQALQDRTRDALGAVRMVAGPSCWPLIGLRAVRLTAPRVALIAEAAHVLHPLGAQGLNLSLRDTAALAETIADAARLGLDIGSSVTLAAYEKRRVADVDGRVYGTEGFNSIVSNNKSAIHGLRRAGLRLVSGIGPLRTLAMQQGLAPQDENSRLLKGHAL